MYRVGSIFMVVWCWGDGVAGYNSRVSGMHLVHWMGLQWDHKHKKIWCGFLLPLVRFLTTTLLLVGLCCCFVVCLVCCLLKSWVSDFLWLGLCCNLRSSPFDSEVETEAVTLDSVASSDSLIIMPSLSSMPSVAVVVVVSWRFSLQNSI